MGHKPHSKAVSDGGLTIVKKTSKSQVEHVAVADPVEQTSTAKLIEEPVKEHVLDVDQEPERGNLDSRVSEIF